MANTTKETWRGVASFCVVVFGLLLLYGLFSIRLWAMVAGFVGFTFGVCILAAQMSNGFHVTIDNADELRKKKR